MKRLLIVLFGVLVFQGSVWAESCLKNWPPDTASVTKAKILHPVSANQMIVKKSSFGLAWHERGSVGDFLGSNVNIRLYEQGDDKQDLFKNRLINKPNTGFFLINKKDFRTAKVKSGKQYYFAVQKAGTAAAGVQIQSECFTFDIKAKEDLQCNAATNMKECLKVLVSQNRAFLERLSELEGQITASPGSTQVISTSVKTSTNHSHPEYVGSTHSHNFASSSHTHAHETNQGIATANLDNDVSDEQVINAIISGRLKYHNGYPAARVHKAAQASTQICYSPSQQEWVVGFRPVPDNQGRAVWNRQNEIYFQYGTKRTWKIQSGPAKGQTGRSAPDWAVIHPAHRVPNFEERVEQLYWDAALKERPPLSDSFIQKRAEQMRRSLRIESPIDCGILVDRPQLPDWDNDERLLDPDFVNQWFSQNQDDVTLYLQAARVCVLPGLIDISARWAEAFEWGEFDNWNEMFGGYGMRKDNIDATTNYLDYTQSGAHISFSSLAHHKDVLEAEYPDTRRIDEFVCNSERYVMADSMLQHTPFTYENTDHSGLPYNFTHLPLTENLWMAKYLLEAKNDAMSALCSSLAASGLSSDKCQELIE